MELAIMKKGAESVVIVKDVCLASEEEKGF
jgi:hypothetical protein